MSYSSEVLADSPLAYYRLDDTSGSTMLDSSGNGHSGTYAGGFTLGATGLLVGDSNKAVDFASASSTVTGASWMTSTTAVTVEAIIQPDTVSAGSYNFIAVRDDNNGTGNLWWLVTKATKLTALCRGTEFSGSTTLVAGNTYHVAFTYDGTTAKLYLNGVLDGSSARSGAMSSVTQDLAIGRWPNPSVPLYFDGRIDEVAYYGTALSSTRIAAHYTAATVPPVSGTASLSLSATGSASGATSGTASLSLSATGTATGLGASGTASLSLSATGSAVNSSASGTASLSLSATGSAFNSSASGTASLSLSATGSASGTSGGASLSLTASGTAVAVNVADTTNAFTGLDLVMVGVVTITAPVVAPVTPLTVLVDKAVPLPMPTLVNGRPT
jgi:hypothetical protein